MQHDEADNTGKLGNSAAESGDTAVGQNLTSVTDYSGKENIDERTEARPTDLPQDLRRSSRTRRKPAWFDSYNVNQVVVEDATSRLDTVNRLIKSGILNTLEPDVANKLLDIIMM